MFSVEPMNAGSYVFEQTTTAEASSDQADPTTLKIVMLLAKTIVATVVVTMYSAFAIAVRIVSPLFILLFDIVCCNVLLIVLWLVLLTPLL